MLKIKEDHRKKIYLYIYLLILTKIIYFSFNI